MRARQLKPGIFKNEKLGSADPLLTILFEGLWCMADRAGRMEDRPLRICAEVFPYRRGISEKKVSKLLDWLEAEEFVSRYEVAGKRFLQVLNFSKHQNPHTDEKHSVIPALTSKSHRATTGEAPGEPDKSPEPIGLTPDSGLLTPDSSLRETRASDRPMAAETNGVSDAHQTWIACKSAYPSGLWEGPKEILAERAIGRLLDDGIKREQLVSAAAKYCAQLAATGKVGTEYVRGPEKFYGDGFWRGPFPLPQASSPKTAGLSMDELRAKYPEAASG